MNNNNFFYKTPNKKPLDKILKGKASSLYLNKKEILLDCTAGRSTLMCLGYSNKAIIKEMQNQLKLFPHIDCNIYNFDLAKKLSSQIIQFSKKKLDKVYFSGSSGSEAIEAAMKLSFQIHETKKNNLKRLFISRENSYHGATLGAMSVSHFAKFKSYKKTFPNNVIKIPEYNIYNKNKNENTLKYTNRHIKIFENIIKKYRANKICAFIGSTQLSIGQGHSEAHPSYWPRISKICKANNIHLILDEVYCGSGRSGEYFCFNNYACWPDFVCLGKNLTAGYAPLSVVVTKKKFENIIKKNTGEFFHAHTFQGYALGVAAAYASIKYIRKNNLLNKIKKDSAYIKSYLSKVLGDSKNFINIRGIGLHLSVEFRFKNNKNFEIYFEKEMRKKGILIKSLNRFIHLSPTYILTKKELHYIIKNICTVFLEYKDQ